MTALADLLSPADRERLAARLAELRDLDSAMRERGGLPPLPPPRPLHKMTAVAPERPRTQEAGQHQPKGVTSKMTEPRTRFEGEWADGSQAVIDIGSLPAQSGLRVSISARGGWPGLHDAEMLFTPGEAVELADALLMIAAAESDGAAKPMGAKFEADRDPRATGWWIRRPS